MPIPFIPAPNCAKVQMTFLLDGQRVMLVFNVQRTAPFTTADRTQTNTAFHSWWTNNLKPLLATSIALVEITTTNLDSATSPATVETVAPPEPGLQAGNSYPGGTALVITHRTALRGRNYRGRSYLPGIPESYYLTTNGTSATVVGNFLTAFAALITILTAINDVLVVLSKFLNKLPRGTAVATPITAFSGDTFWDSQRRRLTGRGS